MKKLNITAIIAILFLLLFSPTPAQVNNINEMTVVVPAKSIAKFIEPLLPYRIDIGKNFLGSFWVKSIRNLKIDKDRISFSAHIYGKDIRYSTKLGNQKATFKVGNVDLQNRWESSLRYDKSKKKLYIKPHIEALNKDKKDLSQGDILLYTLFNALSDIEYPLDVNKLKPITTKFYDEKLTINMDISDVYADMDKLFIKIIPIAQKKGVNTQ